MYDEGIGEALGRGGGQERPEEPAIICFSHLRWNFVFQRPQHVMTRLAAHHRVFFVEEPHFSDEPSRLRIERVAGGVHVVVPLIHRLDATDPARATAAQRGLLSRLLRAHDLRDYVCWYYTPMALPISRHLAPLATVYDCMDELSGFAGAPSALGTLEAELLTRADLVTTGGRSLYEAKRERHGNVHAFPSSVDVAHFAAARDLETPDPRDQADLPRPRIGFAGVIDERMDLALVRGVAAARPDWHVVLLGPVAKISPATLPRAANVHQLGMKSYAELPAYMSRWDVGILPFAHNAATRFISPTKTPEYLAAGLPVVSTSIRDVVDPYGTQGLARIADGVEGFVSAIEQALAEDRAARLVAADALLARTSWDDTVARMRGLMLAAIDERWSAPSDREAAGESEGAP
jgi:UDP-galactopyranose mutase